MKLETLLKTLASSNYDEMQIEPDSPPSFLTPGGKKNASDLALTAATITAMMFRVMTLEDKLRLPNLARVNFNVTNELGTFAFTVAKSAGGLTALIRKVTVNPPTEDGTTTNQNFAPAMTYEVNEPTLPQPPKPSYQIPQTSYQTTVETPTKPVIPVKIADPEETTKIFENTPNQPAAKPKSFLGSLQSVFMSGSKADEGDDVIEVIEEEDYDAPPQPVAAKPRYEPQAYVEKSYSTPPPKQQHQSNGNPQQKAKMEALLRKMAEMKASDLHLSVSMPPMVRLDGKMQTMESGQETLTNEAMRDLLWSIMPERNREEFDRRSDTDFAYEIANLARFRVNMFMDRKGVGAVFRLIPTKILTAEQLGLSEAVLNLCNLSKGLVLVTGPTGSGKSTTLAAMIDHINKNRDDHLITIEDPIEFVHQNQKCLVNQREVHTHTDSFKDALRAALREDPDIVLVGEMRDLETIAIAIETAETGHLVFGTLHTTTAPSTVDRIIDQFPADRQQQIRVMLSESLKGVIAQTLLPKRGGGRVAALEILIVTPAISNLIREGKTFQIASSMQTGKDKGMRMLNDSLFELVKKGLVTPNDALVKAVDKTGMEIMLNRHTNGM